MKLTRLFKLFFKSNKSGGIVLIFVTILSMAQANSLWATEYINFWNMDLGGHTLVQWINDGLMTIFFLLIGLELEREIYQGELSSIKNAALPMFGALGGMLIPAGIFLLLNYGTDTQSGAGIPMATDIAFAIGILSLLGKRVPSSLKIFLIALAVMDDLGAIIVIAIFYTKTIIYTNLFIALGIFGALLVLNRLKIHNLIPYLIGGVVMWYFMLNSGIHATISGVLLAFAIPFGSGKKKSASYILQHKLHYIVAFFVLPIFAVANTGIAIGDDWASGLIQVSGLGIILGLVIGKPLGIYLFSLIGVGLRLCSLPPDLKWSHIIGVGFLGGIGFTMSIFVTLLAFEGELLINSSKIAILVASIIAGGIGLAWLRFSLSYSLENEDDDSIGDDEDEEDNTINTPLLSTK